MRSKLVIIFLIFVFSFNIFFGLKIPAGQAAILPPNPNTPPCHQPAFLPTGWQQLKSQTWTKQDSPYCLGFGTTLPENETLTIEAGAVIKFYEPYIYGWYKFGAKLDLQGKVYINGTQDEPVVFTSIFDDSYLGDTNGDGDATQPAPGDWANIVLSNSQEKIINWAVFKYGAHRETWKMVYAGNGGNIAITHSIFTRSQRDAIHVAGNFKKFEYNKIYDNGGAGLVNVSQGKTIDARHNWWGSDQGPYVAGQNEPNDPAAESLAGNFIFQPWLILDDFNPVPNWRRNIQPGDILYDPYSAGVGHVALYIGDNKTIEAQGDPHHPFDPTISKVRENNISKWDYPNRKNVYLLRVKKPPGLDDSTWQTIKNNVIQFVKDQRNPVEKPYNWAWLTKSHDPNASAWYCSELVWAAYFNQGINLERYGDPDGVISPVSPAEIFLDDDTYIVNGHYEYQGGWRDYVFLMVLSPVEVTVTDSQGNLVNTADNIVQIPGATFVADYVDHNGHVHDRIYLPNGQYQITVTPKPDAQSDETYSLIVQSGDQQIILAQDEKTPPVGQNHFYTLNTNQFSGGLDDNEGSSDNTWTAATLDLVASSTLDFNPPVTPDQNSTGTASLLNNGSLDFNYRAQAANFSGSSQFCNNLNLTVSLGSQQIYHGLLANFNQTIGSLAASTSQRPDFTLSLPNQSAELQNQTCHFDFIFQAWQANYAGYNPTSGFSDQEIIHAQVASGEWVQTAADHLLINEIYYDVDGEHGQEGDNEWFELYNPTNQPINLNGWQICDNHDCDNLAATTTLLQAQTFALVTMASSTLDLWNVPTSTLKIILNSKIGNGLANSDDRLILKNPTGEEIDAVSYGNDTYAFDPACPNVAEGHSLARRETGLDTNTADDWLDISADSEPVGPSPGG